LGAELLSLCQSATADGRLSTSEIGELRTWLDSKGVAELPAVDYLRELVARVVADGVITPEEQKAVHRAIESVLPKELRLQSLDARLAVEQSERAEKRLGREKERENKLRNARIANSNFMVAGVRYEGRPAVIARYCEPGCPVQLVRDAENQYSKHAIAVFVKSRRQIGVVPEIFAEGLAPLLDEGARVDSWITNILGEGRGPIPVVQAIFYSRESTVEVGRNRSAGILTRALGLVSGRSTASETRSKAAGVPRWAAWVIALAAIALAVSILWRYV
jgi:hypothetical protein